MIWIKKEINAVQIRELARQYDIDMILSSILARRNITAPEEIKFFLEDDIRFLHNPFLFREMGRVVERIRRAARENEKVLVYGDRDVDGITATVLVVEVLSSLGLAASWKVPIGDEDYGLSLPDVDEAVRLGVTLLVTVDCGISNFKEIEYAKGHGIDVIVLDHHVPQENLPAAHAIIDPKLPDSGYPFRDLAGCGVAAKADWAVAFSRGAFYNRPVALLHVCPLNESFLIEAVALDNLVVTGRFRENVVPPLGKDVFDRLKIFCGEREIFVVSLPEVKGLIRKAFGETAGNCAFSDSQPLIAAAFPPLAGKSLLKIREMSRIGRYSGKTLSEMEVFQNLFVSVVLRSEKTLYEDTIKRLDLAALGTIADLMPLVNENRIIVKKGLEVLSRCPRRGLRELLLRKNLLGKELSAKDIAWQISPIINASGRLGEPNKAVELLLATDQERLDELALYICKLNEKRKELGDSVWKKMYGDADQSFKKTDGKFILISGASIHRGITGIMATKMVNHFNAPACVVAELKEKAVGSLRSVKDVSLTPFLLQFRDLFSDYGGHDMAAGFNLPLERLDAFKERFYSVVETLSPAQEREERIFIDAEIPAAYLTPDLYAVVERLVPFGEANPPMLFHTAGLAVEACDVIGKKEQAHLKLLLAGAKYKFPGLLWNGADLYGERFKIGDRVDVLYRLQKNFFMNTETLQLVIRDIAVAGEKELKTLRADEPFFDSAGVSTF